MPEISRFFGIVVYMNTKEHPPPHVHVRYSGAKASVSIEAPYLIKGRLPPRVVGMLIEWVRAHRNALLENWDLMRRRLPVRRIPPLG